MIAQQALGAAHAGSATTLGEICGSGSGLQTGPFGSQLKAEEYVPEGVPVVMPKDIVDGSIVGAGCSCVSIEKSQVLSKHRLVKGDVVFSRRGDVGVCALVSETQEGYLCGTGCLRARPDPSIDPMYLISYLTTEEPIRWLKQNAIGQTMPNLNTHILACLPILIPPPSVVNQLRDYSVTFNHGITKTKLLIDANLKRKRALLQQILTGKLRFPEFVRTNHMRPTRYGLYPSDWDYPCVGHIAKEVCERSRSENRYTVLSCSKHQGLVDSLEYFGKRVFSSDTSNYKVVRRGQFAYATNHIEEGSIGLLTTNEAGLISPIYTVFETDLRKVYAPFLFRLFKTELYRHIFEVNTSSSVDRRGSLRWTQFATIHVPLPSLGEQLRIAAVLDTVDEELALLTQYADVLSRQKNALIQKLLAARSKSASEGGHR